MTTDYTDVPDLAEVYLEDSFVLEIVEDGPRLRFRLDAVLTERHPAYHPPKPGENYCYEPAWLLFDNCTRIDWITRTPVISVDAAGEEDLGPIDAMLHQDTHWHLEGDWGQVDVHTSTPPRLLL